MDKNWNALQTAAELDAHNERLHADNERPYQALLADRAEINVLHKDMLRSQLICTSRKRSSSRRWTQAMITVSGKWDRVLDLAEKFLLGGSGDGRSGQ